MNREQGMIRISEERSGDEPVLRIEGALGPDDVPLVESVYEGIAAGGSQEVVVDVSGLTFVGAEGAALLSMLRRERGAVLRGHCLFTKEMIDGVEFEQRARA
jgi:hypothetical protein